MTAPNQGDPSGALGPGDFHAFQAMTPDDAKSAMTSGTVTKVGDAHNSHQTNVVSRIDGNYALVLEAQGKADQAVTKAQAAANQAAAADSTAASASARASYWEAEFVVASAAVVLGVNELLIGLCQNVPVGLNRTITDMHAALLTQPNGMSFDLMKWDATGTVASTLGSFTLAANQTRRNWPNLNCLMANKERVYINVTSVTGSTAPVVLQILLFGVLE
ncbi:hypothetical protein [Nocardia sp. NPDC049707]|uniref:hypothetical protein n=1 Tax=Nocardia sp. NPDC049707 TaxID=3154735 RepID=UPI00341FED7E